MCCRICTSAGECSCEWHGSGRARAASPRCRNGPAPHATAPRRFDHWVLDVALCNAFGLWIGFKTLAFFRARHFDWAGGWAPRADGARVSTWRKLLPFVVPRDVDAYEWGIVRDPYRTLGALGLVIMMVSAAAAMWQRPFPPRDGVRPRPPMRWYRRRLWS